MSQPEEEVRRDEKDTYNYRRGCLFGNYHYCFSFLLASAAGTRRMEGIGADSGYGNGPVTGALPVIRERRRGDQGDDRPGILFGTEDEKSRETKNPANSLQQKGERPGKRRRR